MAIYFKTSRGQIRHGDNVEEMQKIPDNSVDSCISDFPYDLSFMGKKWDNTGNFYEWCKLRADGLLRIIKPGGYVCIFGHPKTNHRMKCAFEDVGFSIVEEIDWIYLNGFPKNQDIGKLFDKKAGVEREVIGIDQSKLRPNRKSEDEGAERVLAGGFKSDNGATITTPMTDLAKQWDGWKTAGLKPAHEPITIFQKPLAGTYIQNIEKHSCGCMNIDACRIPISQEDVNMLNAKASKNPTTNYSDKDDKIYGSYAEDKCVPANPDGRFPPNLMFDEEMAKELDEQTGIKTNTRNMSYKRSKKGFIDDIPSQPEKSWFVQETGAGSRMFPIFKYCPKVSPSERKLPSGERNPHVTVKPKELIKWLIKLVTPNGGRTIDITAGSCTHGVACEELNRDEDYNLMWLNIELMQTETEPYCETGKMRIEEVLKQTKQ